MKIVIDDKIPYIREAVEALGVQAVYLPGAEISPEDVSDADALIVRTRTRCDESLLKGSKVSFVGTATIGFDHIDVDYLERAGIRWTNCPGCNAASVAQYLRSSLLLLEHDFGLTLSAATIGIVGCGHVGSRVQAVCESLGMRVMVCDPPLKKEQSCTLADIAAEADVITFHVPMERGGDHPTWHMADEAFFSMLRRSPFIINTSRGGVVDNGALLAAIKEGQVRQAVIDVWEGEPDINPELLQRAYIATPHIAGYSADGKVNANNMVLEALCRHFALAPHERIVPPSLPRGAVYGYDPANPDPSIIERLNTYPIDMQRQLLLYNPLEDTRRLREHPEDFEHQRGNYPLRRENI